VTDTGEKNLPAGGQSDAGVSEALERNWKYYLGMTLFVYSFATFGIAAAVPLLGIPAAKAAELAMGVIISGEVAFLASAALLGKPFVKAMKAKVMVVFRRKGPVEPRPVSRQRHTFGIVLLVASTITYYLALAGVFFLPREQALDAVAVSLVAGEALFIASLVVLGAEFWARLKRLFEWPGEAPAY